MSGNHQNKALNLHAIDHLDIWTSAWEKKTSGGRGGNGKLSPYGIQKLRELILELAVRGRLVPQDPNDEPASVLLEKIAEEKARLVKEGKIKKPKKLPEITDEEKPHELPEGWEWVRLGEITKIQTGTLDANASSPDGEYPFFTCAREPLRIDGYRYDTEAVLLAGNGNFDVNYYKGKFEAYQRTYIIEAVNAGLLSVHYLYRYVLRYAEKLREQAIGGVIKYIKIGFLTEALFPVPPLAEQHRIVAKVDELMALCDRLEQEQTDSREAHQTLVETLLRVLTDAPDAEAAQQAWQRIAQHFDHLFTTETAIDLLKQTILQLAVMGKLVPQDPNDERASVLLENIAKEKARLVKEGRIKKQRNLPEITDEEKPFYLPNGWEWIRFGDLALHSEAGWSPKCLAHPREGNGWGVLKVSAVTWGRFRPEENKALPRNLKPRAEFEVQPGDFLISRANTAELVAKAVVVPRGAPTRLIMSDKIIRFVFPPELDYGFLALVNGSPFARRYYLRVAGGTSSSMKNVSREQIRRLVVALPPVAEQRRIVSRVEEFISLCNVLKTHIRQRNATQLELANSVVRQALSIVCMQNSYTVA